MQLLTQALISALTNIVTLKNSWDLKLYPNPASKTINITLNEKAQKISEIEIFNMLGERVLKNQLAISNSMNKNYEIEIAQFPAGTYFLKYSSLKINKVIKFNIVH